MPFPSVHPITHVRSVTIAVEELATATNFYRDLWQLDLVTKDDGKAYFGTGCADNYAIKLRENDVAGIELTTFDVTDRAGVDFLAKRVADSGARIIREPGDRSDFGGGYSCIFFDCDGRAIELAAEIDQRIFREVEAAFSR